MKICGIDEAGRGPVIGPMIIAGVTIEEENIGRLREIGVRDSKELRAGKRREIFDKLQDVLSEICVVKIQPWVIDFYIRYGKSYGGLNRLEADFMREIIRRLRPEKVFVDCCDVDEERFLTILKEGLPEAEEITIEAVHHADALFEIVSAASIVAKESREREIEKIKEMVGEIGSGYPSDPLTRKFIRENPNLARYYIRRMWNITEVEGRKFKGLRRFFSLK